RSALDLEHPPHRGLVGRVGPQAVDRLGRDGDEAPPTQGGEGVVQDGTASTNSSAASMKPNDSGVAKWSVRFSVFTVASGSFSASGSPGPAKSLSPMTISVGT